MRQRLIACGGMNRSGSTWQFNAVRELIKAGYPNSDIYSCWIDAYNESQPADVHIVKIHASFQLGPHTPDTIFTSFRDLRAVAGSLIRMGWVSPEGDPVCAFLEFYITQEAILKAAAHYSMRYETMVAMPIQVLGEMAAVLKLDLAADDIVLVHDRLRSLKPPVGEPSGDALALDVDTQLHRGHIGGIFNEAAIKFVAPSIEADIDLRFADWLLDHGYPTRRFSG